MKPIDPSQGAAVAPVPTLLDASAETAQALTQTLRREAAARWARLRGQAEAAASAETWSHALAETGPWLRRTRRLHRALARRAARRLEAQPALLLRIAAGAALVWLMGAFFFGALWLGLTAAAVGWGVYAAQEPDPAWD